MTLGNYQRASARLRTPSPAECAVRWKRQRRTSAPNLSTGYVPVRTVRVNPPQHRVGALPRTHQLLLILDLRLNLDAARLDAFLQRERKAQHAVAM
jgi:hypothetical protein